MTEKPMGERVTACEVEIAGLKDDLGEIKDIVTTIRDNHLPHLRKYLYMGLGALAAFEALLRFGPAIVEMLK